MDDLVKRLRISWDSDKSIISQTGEWMAERRAAADRIEAQAARIAELEARIAEGPQVKPLVWTYHPAGTIAVSPTGHAYIIDTRTKGRVYSLKGFNPPREFSTLEEAKTAVDADNASRIRAALVPTAPPAQETRLTLAATETGLHRLTSSDGRIHVTGETAIARLDAEAEARIRAAQQSDEGTDPC